MSVIKLVGWTLLIVAATFFLHEAAHGLAGAALGYDVFIRVNSSGLVDGEYRSQGDDDLISAIGPIVTLLQGVLGVVLVTRFRSLVTFSVVLSALAMRMLAAVASLRLPNDEARLGVSWGVGYWTVHLVVIAALLGLTYWAWTRFKPGALSMIGLFVLILACMVVVVVAEGSLPTIYL